MTKGLRCLLALFPIMTALPAAAGDLTLEIGNVEPGVGQLLVGVCSEAKFLDDDGCEYETTVAVQSNPQRVVITDVKPGRYAVKIAYDLNMDRKVGTNILGMPREPVGFSNNLTVNLGPPRFSKAAVEVGEEDQTIQISLTPWDGEDQ